ncbi:hypothetical protein D9M68_882360 [compost metagenome]
MVRLQEFLGGGLHPVIVVVGDDHFFLAEVLEVVAVLLAREQVDLVVEHCAAGGGYREVVLGVRCATYATLAGRVAPSRVGCCDRVDVEPLQVALTNVTCGGGVDIELGQVGPDGFELIDIQFIVVVLGVAAVIDAPGEDLAALGVDIPAFALGLV